MSAVFSRVKEKPLLIKKIKQFGMMQTSGISVETFHKHIFTPIAGCSVTKRQLSWLTNSLWHFRMGTCHPSVALTMWQHCLCLTYGATYEVNEINGICMKYAACHSVTNFLH